MVTIATLLGVVSLVSVPLIGLPKAYAQQTVVSGARTGGLSTEILPRAPTKPTTPRPTPSPAPSASTTKTASSAQSPSQGTGQGTQAPQAPPTQAAANQVTMSVDALAPEVLHSDQDLILTGTITNGTEQLLNGVDLAARLQRSTEVTSHSLRKWLSGTTDESGLSDPFTVPLGRDIQPGEVTQFSITVPADQLPLTNTDQWGPRGIAVSLEIQGAPLAQDRSIVVWDSGASVTPVRLTTFIPVTASTQEMTVLAGPHTQEREDVLTRVRSRVLGLLNMAGEGTVMAVDPGRITGQHGGGRPQQRLPGHDAGHGHSDLPGRRAVRIVHGRSLRSRQPIGVGPLDVLDIADRLPDDVEQDLRGRHPALHHAHVGHRYRQPRGSALG